MGRRTASLKIWDELFSRKLEKLKVLAGECLPPDLLEEVLRFAGEAKALAGERRSVVHALVIHEVSPPPAAMITILRTERGRGLVTDPVPLAHVKQLAARVESAAETGLALTKSVADALPGEDDLGG